MADPREVAMERRLEGPQVQEEEKRPALLRARQPPEAARALRTPRSLAWGPEVPGAAPAAKAARSIPA